MDVLSYIQIPQEVLWIRAPSFAREQQGGISPFITDLHLKTWTPI